MTRVDMAFAPAVAAQLLADEPHAGWLMPFHAFMAGGAAVAAGEWDDAVAVLDAGLELAHDSDPDWISIAVGQRAYVDAHRGQVDAARERLDTFRESGLPPRSGHDFPGQADLAVLEAAGAGRAAAMLARELWSAAPARGAAWMLTLAPDVIRVALAAMERDLVQRVAAQVAEIDAEQNVSPRPTAALTRGVAAHDRELVATAIEQFAASGWLIAAAHAQEEYSCLAAARGDRDAAVTVMDRACAVYDHAGAAVDRSRLLSRLRALGVRRGPRSRHTTTSTGWAALTPTERRVADLVRKGRTNPEIAAQLFVSPRTVQTHVSHILSKLGARSRVEIARQMA